MGIKSNLPEEIKDAVARDYLRGDKAIVIQLEYKISPGTMYRILHEREVPLRSEGESAPVPDEGADETESVPDEGADETESVPPVVQESGFLAALKALAAQDPQRDDAFRLVSAALEEWFPQEDAATLKAIGLWEKATGEGITPEEIVEAAMVTFITVCLRAMPGVEEIEPDVFRRREVQV